MEFPVVTVYHKILKSHENYLTYIAFYVLEYDEASNQCHILAGSAIALVGCEVFPQNQDFNKFIKAKENPMRHLLNPSRLLWKKSMTFWLFWVRTLEQNLPQYAHVCDGKKLATLFMSQHKDTFKL